VVEAGVITEAAATGEDGEVGVVLAEIHLGLGGLKKKEIRVR
jgi:hypothetical protein